MYLGNLGQSAGLPGSNPENCVVTLLCKAATSYVAFEILAMNSQLHFHDAFAGVVAVVPDFEFTDNPAALGLEAAALGSAARFSPSRIEKLDTLR